MNECSNCPAFIADVRRQCRTNPSEIAVIDNDGRRSCYGEFYDLIKKTCGYIDHKGIKRGSLIVINLPNCMEYLAVEFGVWLSGCGIVPVSPLYPAERINYIKAHCETPLTVDEAVLAEIEAAEPSVICDADADIAAVFYTSGSTGTPKGVIHTFSTLSVVDCYDEVIDIRQSDCFGYGSPMSFIAWATCLPFLRAGACVKLIDRGTMTDVKKLRECLSKDGITVAFFNPSLLRQLDLSAAPNLRFIFTGSERVSGLKPHHGCKIVNAYGMTETTGIVCHYPITGPSENPPVGKFFSCIDCKLEEDGEICLRGPLTPGYYKDPERSAELWRGGWMHTGDIGHVLPDGNLEYLSRKDWMVKINGQRVEMGEVIEVTKQMPGVADATAKGFTAAGGRQYVVAYYVADESVSEAALKEFLSGKLAPYMMPSHYVRMDALPKNTNGKVDMKALQSPAEIDMASRNDIVLPVTECQKVLCLGFEASLGISPVGIDDDFFALGGDSIRVMQLQTSCPELNLSSTMVYRLKTVRAIASELEMTETGSNAPEGQHVPLSKTQTGIFAGSMARRGEAVYNNPILFEFTDVVDAGRLAEACVTALKSHPDIFASVMVGEDGSAYQVKGSAEDFAIEVETLSDKEFERVRKGLVKPFDILADRLFRINVFKTESAVWLFYDFHHIIFDGSSNTIILNDIEAAYYGKSVDPEPYTGFDLACDEEALRKTGFLDECREWNLDTFREPDQTSLPDPDNFNDEVTFDKFDIDTGISVHAFAQAAQRLGITENILATGAFGYMLGTCTHSVCSAFATVYNGRKSLKTRRTVSMLVKTLPVYCKWDKNTLAGDYFKSVKEQLMGAMAHDLFSFGEVCKESAYDSRVIFSYQDGLLERKRLCGARCRMTSLLENATGEPLTVQLYKQGGTLSIRTEYRSNLYSMEYIRRYIECFSTVLSSLILAEKDTPASSIALVTESEKSALISAGWGRRLDFDRSLTVAGMFQKSVALHPDDVAVVDENGALTYAELDSLSDSIACRLEQAGVKSGDFVALMLPRLNLFPASYLACFKSGAAYVPIDYEYPVDRLQYMIDDSEAKVLVTTHWIFDKKQAEGLAAAAEVIFADDIDFSAENKPVADKSDPDGLAYMIYTSGTTGKPKGVMIEHHSLANLVNWYADACGIAYGSRVAEHASFSFDGSIADLMTPLCFGARLYILPSGIRKDLPAMHRYLGDNRIDSVLLTTQLGMAMLRIYDLNLKCLVVGGEKLSGVFKTSVRLLNAYGPTEFTVASSYSQVDTDAVPANIPIGKAVPNTLSAVVDLCGRLLPRGVAGELVLAGEQLSRGYWHRPDITAERFTQCPFLPGEKMYHTGDLVKWDANGELLFLGRIDTQVKLRGFRIELGEIESNMAGFAGIKSAVVAIKEIAGLQHLCAYYTADSEIDKEALRSSLAAALTDYMVPTAYIQMEALPMTPNGKVDLKALPLPEIKAAETVAPAGPLETKMFETVAAYLGNRKFGVTSNLISLGLTSLGAISLSLLLEKQAGVKIPSPKILEHPTIREWAEYLDKSASSSVEVIPQYERQEHYPLTDNQTGVYIDWEQHRDSIQYNVPMLFRFKGVAPKALCDTLKSFVRAHSYLKTHLEVVDGEIVQTRNDKLEPDIQIVVLENEPDMAFFQSQLEPFDLFKGPLFRFTVFSGPDSVWLVSDIHHIVFDGGSEAVFAREIVDALAGAPMKDESFTAFDYSLYYKEWKESDEFAKAENYFINLLDGAVPATVPSTMAPQGSGAATILKYVDRPQLRKLCRNVGVTENALFLSAVTQVLHRFSREDNLAILTVSNGRSLSVLDRSCGMFVQTLPVVSRKKSCNVREALTTMHREIADTLSHDKYPYTQIVEKTGLKADILLAYQGDVLGGPLEAGGHVVELTGLTPDTAKFPLSINVTPEDGTTEMCFEYDRAVYSKADIERFADAVKCFIENLADEDAPISDVPVVSADDMTELLAIGSGPQMEVCSGTVADLFCNHAAKYPDDPAVTDANSTISYRELDKASDTLAEVLIDAGIHNENFVSLMLPRTKEYVIAFLAVYKSGGAYVPMDYEYPMERLQYMVDDSQSDFLLTTHDIFAKKSQEGDIKVRNIIYVDDLNLSDTAPAVNRSTPDGLAYMIYTSGTTGKPKGVMIEHKALMNMIHWERDLAGLERGSHFAEHASFSFDASIMDLMTTIAFGGHLYIIPEEFRKEPAAMQQYLTDNKIEGLVASTQLGMMLLNSYNLPIRYIMMGGEKLTGRYDRSIKVVNGYGPTEFTVCSSYHVLDPDNEPDNIPIGKAVPNTLSAVVDLCGNLLPKGTPGELVLIGPQIARGYWNKAEITSKRFVNCPFVEGKKMYRTGDLVRWNDDGELLFMGRIDTQVKLRGFRIELGEIESQIAAFPDVTAAVAQVKETGGVQHLCAYFTASSDVDISALNSHLKSILTSYMVPDSLMQLDEFPLTPNGKVDVKRLPAPVLLSDSEKYVAPEGESETFFAATFAELLGLDKVGADDSFFSLGGTSLLVMKVVINAQAKGYALTYADVFTHPTPKELASMFKESRPAEDDPDADVKDYDYSKIETLLSRNRLENFLAERSLRPLGDVLLTGATGFLGIHVLRHILEHCPDSKVHCLLRPRKSVPAADRLRHLMFYYFESDYGAFRSGRIAVHEGDVTSPIEISDHIDTVINCAALVKHFSQGGEIEDVNVGGAVNCVDFCLKSGARLIQISTYSVAGSSIDGFPDVRFFTEEMLYVGQTLRNQYIHSKIMAERLILEAVADKGLDAKIMRVGNLSARAEDGEFQINVNANSFMGRLRIYQMLGVLPYSAYMSRLEFSPIDETARAICLLATTSRSLTLFHPYNIHYQMLGDVLGRMATIDRSVRFVEDEEYVEILSKAKEDPSKSEMLTSLLAYEGHKDEGLAVPIESDNHFTTQVLVRLGFQWDPTSRDYVDRFLRQIDSLQYFEEK